MNGSSYHDFLAYFGIGGAHPGGLSLTRKVLDLEDISPRTKVLDVGCGTGQTAVYIAKKYGCKVTALDLHPLILEKAGKRIRRESGRVTLVQGNAEEIPMSIVHTGNVQSLLDKQYGEIFSYDFPELDVSDTLNSELTKVGEWHQLLTERYRKQLDYHYYRAIKITQGGD